MALVINKAEVLTPTRVPSVRVGSWRTAQKVYTKISGTWSECWPLLPNPPQNVTVATPQVGEIIVVDAAWAAAAGGATAPTGYRVRATFTDPATNVSANTAWVERTTAQLSYRFDNAGGGWAHRAGHTVRIEVVSVIAATAYMHERQSGSAFSNPATSGSVTPPPVTPIPPVAAPAAPTSFSVTISACSLTQSWAHAGGTSLTKFEIQTWLSGSAVTTYTVADTARAWSTFPWEAATIGRATVNTQIRAVGPGGVSAWVTASGVMPGPVTMSNYGYKNGSFLCDVSNVGDGVSIYTQVYGGTAALQGNSVGGTGTVTYGYTGSSGHARDNVTKRRLGFVPRNSVNGWTGRTQWGAWAIKLPMPYYILAQDCNTWWSLPIPGKWRTNPQAENWFYQGKSVSGNSYGVLFYEDVVPDSLGPSRVGYGVSFTSWDVYVKRTNTGGLVAAVALSVALHSETDDSDNSAPTLVKNPVDGPALSRDQKAWVPLSTSWMVVMMNGTAKGIAFYVSPGDADNQLRSEIGNVSNRYMILDKPSYGTRIGPESDGKTYPPGTLRIYHDG